MSDLSPVNDSYGSFGKQPRPSQPFQFGTAPIPSRNVQSVSPTEQANKVKKLNLTDKSKLLDMMRYANNLQITHKDNVMIVQMAKNVFKQALTTEQNTMLLPEEFNPNLFLNEVVESYMKLLDYMIKHDQLEAIRLEKEQFEKLENDRIAQLEKERIEKEEFERLEKERLEKERIEQLEQERLKKEKEDQLLERLLEERGLKGIKHLLEISKTVEPKRQRLTKKESNESDVKVDLSDGSDDEESDDEESDDENDEESGDNDDIESNDDKPRKGVKIEKSHTIKQRMSEISIKTDVPTFINIKKAAMRDEFSILKFLYNAYSASLKKYNVSVEQFKAFQTDKNVLKRDVNIQMYAFPTCIGLKYRKNYNIYDYISQPTVKTIVTAWFIYLHEHEKEYYQRIAELSK